MDSNKLENTVIVALIAIGVSLGIYFRTQGDSQLSSVLLALALASVLYKFLGGNDADNSLSIGVIKFGGSAAVLGGFIWLLSEIIFKKEEPIIQEQKIELIPSNGWYIADVLTHETKDVELRVGDSTLNVQARDFDVEQLKDREFKLQKEGESQFTLLSLNGKGQILGKINMDQIEGYEESMKGEIETEESFQVFKLFPNDRNNPSERKFDNTLKLEEQLKKDDERRGDFPFPFYVDVYGASFQVKYRDGSDTSFKDLEVIKKRSYYIPDPENSNQGYVLLTLHANHSRGEPIGFYSEWAVLKMTN